jgi:hypothetical protein
VRETASPRTWSDSTVRTRPSSASATVSSWRPTALRAPADMTAALDRERIRSSIERSMRSLTSRSTASNHPHRGPRG